MFGLGLGLYWGEGTKANKSSVRLGNSNPYLIKTFINFLKTIYKIDIKRLHFGLQIFNDVNSKIALDFWIKNLGARRDQFYTPIVSSIRGKGTYTKKAQYGVLTIYFNNKKLRDILCGEIEKLSKV